VPQLMWSSFLRHLRGPPTIRTELRTPLRPLPGTCFFTQASICHAESAELEAPAGDAAISGNMNAALATSTQGIDLVCWLRADTI
jgi:hypothetical protein